MTASRRRRTRQLKWVLAAVIVLCLSTVIALFTRYQRRHDPADTAQTGAPDDATVSVGRVEHTAPRRGRVEWRLSADAVRYLNEEKKAIFESVDITFFTENGEEIRLAAHEGELDTETQNIRITGDVRVTSGGYRLETPKLRYAHDRKVFIAEEMIAEQQESEG